jgi:hypothetical protein
MAKPKGPASAGLFLERRSSSPIAYSRKLERCDDSATKSLRSRDNTVGPWGAVWGRLEGAAAGPIGLGDARDYHSPARARTIAGL